jgi:hypothetical protein
MWQWMIPTLILAIAVMGLSVLAMLWTRRDCATQVQTISTALSERTQAYDTLVKAMLGVPASPTQTETTYEPPPMPKSSEPEDAFDQLSPEIQNALLREHQEFLAKNGTLSGGPARIHPDVPQMIPGQVMTPG